MKFVAPLLIVFSLVAGVGSYAQTSEPQTSPEHWYVAITHDVDKVPNPLVYRQKSAGFASETECKEFLSKNPTDPDFERATLFVLNKLAEMGATVVSISCKKLDQLSTT